MLPRWIGCSDKTFTLERAHGTLALAKPNQNQAILVHILNFQEKGFVCHKARKREIMHAGGKPFFFSVSVFRNGPYLVRICPSCEAVPSRVMGNVSIWSLQIECSTKSRKVPTGPNKTWINTVQDTQTWSQFLKLWRTSKIPKEKKTHTKKPGEPGQDRSRRFSLLQWCWMFHW